MPRNDTIDRFTDAVNQNGDIALDIVRAGNERVYRFNRMLLDEAERTQHERAELFREWASAPTAFGHLTNTVLQTWTRRARRRMELARTMVDDLGDLSAGTRSIWERVTQANRQAVAATATAGRRAAGNAAEEVAERAEDISEGAEDASRSLRQQSRRIRPNGK